MLAESVALLWPSSGGCKCGTCVGAKCRANDRLIICTKYSVIRPATHFWFSMCAQLTKDGWMGRRRGIRDALFDGRGSKETMRSSQPQPDSAIAAICAGERCGANSNGL